MRRKIIKWSFCLTIVSIIFYFTSVIIEMDMRMQFAHNATTRYVNGFLQTTKNGEYEYASGIYEVSRFYTSYLSGKPNDEYLKNAELWFEQGHNQDGINKCNELRKLLSNNERNELDATAKISIQKWQPYFGENIAPKYYFRCTIVCVLIVSLFLYKDITTLFRNTNNKKEVIY